MNLFFSSASHKIVTVKLNLLHPTNEKSCVFNKREKKPFDKSDKNVSVLQISSNDCGMFSPDSATVETEKYTYMLSTCSAGLKITSTNEYDPRPGIKFSQSHFHHFKTKQLYIIRVSCNLLLSEYNEKFPENNEQSCFVAVRYLLHNCT